MPALMKAQAAFTPAFVGGRRDYELPIALEYPTDVTKVIAGGGYKVLVHHRTSGNCGNGHREYVTSINITRSVLVPRYNFQLEAAGSMPEHCY
jgi:hypothetical protein